MTIGAWVIVILCGLFFVVMLIALAGFMVRIFREAQPNRRGGNNRSRHRR